MNGDDEALSAREAHAREAAHRMKNHLALVAGMLRLQARHIRPDDAPRQLVAMADHVLALAHLYDQLTLGAQTDGIDLADYVEGVVTRLRESLHYQCPPEVHLNLAPCKLSADRTADLGLILTELVTNACKHGLSGDGMMRLRIALANDGETAELVCADAGAGLPEDYENSGRMGLKIIRALVDGMNATMTIDSGARGTRFTIRFPLT